MAHCTGDATFMTLLNFFGLYLTSVKYNGTLNTEYVSLDRLFTGSLLASLYLCLHITT